MIRHRGPDAAGIHVDGEAGIAHARLSIIDLEGGSQPMCNEDSTLWITFNGEIFNYIELQEELLRAGHRFNTRSDTEVLLHLYEEKGEACVHSLNGQWAFAILDARNRRLFLSRDRLGIRPLFYTATDREFVFASEIKAIFAHPAIKRRLDLRALDQIFTFWVTLPPRTIFADILELPPGHSLMVDRDGARRPKRYWQLSYPTESDTPARDSEGALAEQLRELLIDATRIRLRSDVPVGAYLSGGLDSTVTTALIRNFTDAPLKTFSVSFDDPEFDESAYQREATQFLGTAHQDVRCTGADIGRVFPDVVWHTETPILRTAPAPLFLLSGLVRRNGFKVVMTGEGGDEVFGGYDIFKEAKLRRFWAVAPDSRFRPLLLKRLYPYLPNLQAQSGEYLKAFFHLTHPGTADDFFSHMPRWEMTSRIKLFFCRDVRASLESADEYAEMRQALPDSFAAWHFFSKGQYLEAAHLLPGYILSSQGDRMAMAHAVEGRFPFLDYRVVEFASCVPPTLKMKVLNEKYILKRAAGDLIPPSVKARTKQPYRAPEGKSFFRPDPEPYVEELLAPTRIRADGLFESAAVEKLAAKFRKGLAVGIRDSMALVGILSTQLVLHHFIHTFGSKVNNGTRPSGTAPVHR